MRYVGSVAWRQNDQTFDGATATITAVPGVTGFYGYIGNVNRIFSDRSPAGNLKSNIHLFHAESKPFPFGTLTGYAYLMDINDDAKLSNASFGGFLQGKQDLGGGLTFNYRFEYARQTDYGNQPVAYDADYVRIEPGVTWSGLTTTLVYELLGSDNNKGFQTPLATGHVFNGFADVFLNTPAAGLQDYYVDVRYKVANVAGDFSFLNGLLLDRPVSRVRSRTSAMSTTGPSSTSTPSCRCVTASMPSSSTPTIRPKPTRPTWKRLSSGSGTATERIPLLS